ncbi:hypothetical protein OVS_01515 [Mycoplasma ovis str. Michigan]|uniref:Transposase n=1 Tax=Mycoplasma ovis str. Michigan TaxID=1415773 RepID=A0ABM5P1E0_9MOLU|nr:hypothetical protein OVS_01515 [Mycoplasma ovis str. Michigan]
MEGFTRFSRVFKFKNFWAEHNKENQLVYFIATWCLEPCIQQGDLKKLLKRQSELTN